MGDFTIMIHFPELSSRIANAEPNRHVKHAIGDEFALKHLASFAHVATSFTNALP